mgnify:CR=1 FL=1
MSQYDFTTDPKRAFPQSLLPPEAADSPIGPFDVEYRRLLALYQGALADLREITRERPETIERDRQALAQAMAAGKPDPGEQATARLHERFVAQKRKVAGLADACQAAYVALRDAIDEHADTFVGQLTAGADTDHERLDALLNELDELLSRTDGARNAIGWLEYAVNADPNRRGDLPSQRASKPGFLLSTTSYPRDHVYAAIRQAAHVPTELRRPAHGRR